MKPTPSGAHLHAVSPARRCGMHAAKASRAALLLINLKKKKKKKGGVGGKRGTLSNIGHLCAKAAAPPLLVLPAKVACPKRGGLCRGRAGAAQDPEIPGP